MTPDPPGPVPLPIADVFDLHSVPPRDAKPAVEAYLEAARAQGFRYLRIIHGRGIGVQREMVRTVLARTPFVRSFGDAPAEAGGWGATLVELGDPPVDELDALVKQYDDTLAEVEQLVGALPPDQLRWKPSGQAWSVAQCLDHLARVGEMYANKVGAAIDEGHREKVLGKGPFAYGWLERQFLRLTEPPPRIRVPAPRLFRPPEQPEGTLEAYREANRKLRGLVIRSRGLDLRRLRVGSPASDWMKFSLGIALAAAVAHERRHIYQMKQILKAAGPVRS